VGSFTESITIGRPIGEVFSVLTEVERTGTWFPGNVEEHWTSPPPHGVGSTRRAIVTMMGRRSENDAVVVAHDPPNLAAMQGLSPRAPFLATLRFASEDGGTRVDVSIELPISGWMRMFDPLVTRWYQGQWRLGLANLKAMLEAGATPGPA
jgi:uncharacterized protein YndB with AHSA1/START domain